MAKHTKKKKEADKSNSFNSLAVLVIVIVVLVVGLLVYQHNHTTPTSSLLARQKYVNTYINANPSKSYAASYYTYLYNKGYITSKSYQEIKDNSANYVFNVEAAFGRYLCVNSLPSSYKYGKPVISSNGLTATIPITEYYAAAMATNGKASTQASITGGTLQANWQKVSGVWKLDMTTDNCF